MINGAQLHLAVNHLPVVASLIAYGIIIVGLLLKNPVVRRTGMAVMVFAGLSGAGAYFSGEPAEHFLKEAAPAAFDKSFIHEHEEAGEIGVIACTLAGLAAAAALFFAAKYQGSGAKFESWATTATCILGFFVVLIMLRTAHLGGLIRHEEIRPIPAVSTEI